MTETDMGKDFSREIDPAENKNKIVYEAFRKLGLSFEIEKYPDLAERLIDTGEHFKDACKMAKTINELWPKLGLPESDREKLLTATILHDIGKAGPVSCKKGSVLRGVMKKLFAHSFFVKPENFGRLAELVGVKNPQEVISAFSSDDLPFNTETPAIVFWRLHVDWTFQVLQAAGIDPEVIKIAASHHILEGKNPAHLEENEIGRPAKILEETDTYQVFLCRFLEVIDKADAVINRGLKTHQEAIVFLRKRINDSELSQKIKDEYLQIVDSIFANSEKDLEILN